ncbi:MAG: N-acetylmuramoyl-L-alanine amidase [Bacillaceae bacterium]
MKKCILLLILLIGLSGCSISKQKKDISLLSANTVEINPFEKKVLPIQQQFKKKIVIDPGHSSIGNLEKEPVSPESTIMKAKDVQGATGIVTNTPEYEIVLNIGLLLREYLQHEGYDVVMTKTTVDTSLSNIERAEIGNEAKADLVIRLHCDSSTEGVRGASILVPAANKFTKSYSEISRVYGEAILNTYCKELGIVNRGIVYRSDLTGFNWSKVPTVLIEMGFLSNPQEDRFLSNNENHSRIAEAISLGVKQIIN